MSRWLYSETVRTGRNAEHPIYDDDQYVKCWNCGFLCHPKRDSHAVDGSRAGDGRTITTVAYDEATVSYDNEAVAYDQSADVSIDGDGCPLCGALNYQKEIPSYGR